MRPIKFRAWNKERLCWVDKFYIEPDGTVRTIGYTALGEPHTDITDKVSLVQYTGLKDKNGKEIYEGDILCSNPNWPYVVFWNNSSARFLLRSLKDGRLTAITSQKNVEVIGNIYENKKLLK